MPVVVVVLGTLASQHPARPSLYESPDPGTDFQAGAVQSRRGTACSVPRLRTALLCTSRATRYSCKSRLCLKL